MQWRAYIADAECRASKMRQSFRRMKRRTGFRAAVFRDSFSFFIVFVRARRLQHPGTQRQDSEHAQAFLLLATALRFDSRRACLLASGP